MEKLAFADGDKIGVFDGEKTEYFESEYLLRYREYAEARSKNDEWKFCGDGARFRGDYELYNSRKERVDAYINGVQWDGEKIVYSFTVNGSSGIYRKNVSSPKEREEHIITSTDEEFLSLFCAGERLAVTVKRDGAVSSVGTIDMASGDLETLTDGDSLDENATFSPDGKIFFDSAGAGRDRDGNFTGKYAPASIFSLDRETLEIKEILHGEKFSYVKPKIAKNGDLYCIKRPAKERRGANPLVEMLLIPVRIFQAIVMFVQSFVIAFTGKSLTEGGENPARGRKQNPRKLLIDGNFIEAERELKRNKRKKDKDYGFIPLSWKLVKISGGKEETIKCGICDFDLCSGGGVYCTNGRHIFYLGAGLQKKIADAKSCLCVATENPQISCGGLFL